MTLMQLLVKIGADPSGFDKGLADMERSLKSTGDRLTGWGTKLSAAVSLPIAAIGGAAVKLGMDAVESENLFSVSFGKMANSARAWSQDLSAALGLNEFELRKLSGTFFTMFDSMGLGTTAAYEMSTGLTQLAYDMASFYNLRPEEAFEKLRAGIMGETEPLKQLGILVDENTTKTYAYTSGLKKQGEELTQNEKVLARFGSIMKQTVNAQGDLARTIESPANQLRLLRTRVEELGTKLGMALVPAVSATLTVLNQAVPYLQAAVDWFTRLSPAGQKVVIAMAAAAAAIGPLLIALGTLMSTLGSMGTMLGSAARLMVGFGTSIQAAAASAATASTGGFASLLAIVTKIGAVAAVAGGAFAGWKGMEWIEKKHEDPNSWMNEIVGQAGRLLPGGGKRWEDLQNRRRISRYLGSEEHEQINSVARRYKGMGGKRKPQADPALEQMEREAQNVKRVLEEALKALDPGMSKAAQKAADEWKEFKSELAGDDVIANAKKWQKAVSDGTRLTTDKQKEYTAALLKGIDALEQTGRTGTSTYRDMVEAYRVAQAQAGTLAATQFKVADTMNSLAVAYGSFGTIAGTRSLAGVTDTIVAPYSNAAATIARIQIQHEAAQAESLARIREGYRKWGEDLKVTVSDAFSGMLTGATSFEDGFKSIFSRIGDFARSTISKIFDKLIEGVAGALTGTGSLKDAWKEIKNILSGGGNKWAGVAVSGAIAGTVGYGVGNKYGKVAGALAGAGTGAALGTMAFPGVGTAIGAGVGALAGWFGGKSKEKDQKKAMEEDRASLLAAYGGMENLREAAKKVGVEIDKAFSTKKPEEFGQIVGQLTERLDAQKKRMEGIGNAFDAITKRSEVFASALDKADTSDEIEKHRESAIKAVRDPESADGQAQLAAIKTHYDEQVTAARAAVGANEQLATSYNLIGVSAAAAVAAAIRETGDATAAYQSVQPAVDQLVLAQQTYGFAMSDTAKQLVENATIVNGTHAQEFQALSANLQIWNSLSDAQAVSADLYQAFGADAVAIHAKITEGGVSNEKALALMQPTLQKLWEAQRKFGNVTDDSTAALIKEAETQGLVGEQMQSVNQRILDVLISIGDVLGAKLPSSMIRSGDAMEKAGKRIKDDLYKIEGSARTTADGVERAFREIEMPTLRVPVEVETPSGLPSSIYQEGTQTVRVDLDGRTIAEATVPHIAEVVIEAGA